MGKLATALVLVVFVFGAAITFLPWLTEQRTVVAGTPSLEALYSQAEVKVPARKRACIRPIAIDQNARQVRMLLHTVGRRAPVVGVTLTAPGYRATGRFEGYAPGGATPAVASLSKAPPGPAAGELCVRNTGQRAIGLVGSNEPASMTLPVTYIGHRSAGEIDPAITLYSGEDRSLLQQAGTILDRAAGFTGVVPGWMMWPLALLLVAVLPLGTATALWFATRAR